MATYQSSYTGAEIDAAVGAAKNPDTSLSQSGKAAEGKAVGDAIKAISKNIGDDSYSSASYRWISFPLLVNHTYRISNKGSSNITAINSTTSSGNYTFVENFGNLSAGAEKTITPTIYAPYLAVYMAGAGSYEIIDLTTLDSLFASANDNHAAISECKADDNTAILQASGREQYISITHMWMQNGINTSNGADWVSAPSIRTDYMLCPTDMDIIVKALAANSVAIFEYDSAKTFLTVVSVPQSGTIVSYAKGHYYRICVYGTLTNPVASKNGNSYVSVSIKNKLYDGIPDYYKSYLQNKISTIIENSAFIQGISFPFITDVHFHANSMNSAHLIKYIDEHTNAVPFVIFGGDVPKAVDTSANVYAYAKKWNEYMSIWGKHKTIQLHGNHDYMCALDNTLTNLWFAPLSKVFEFVQQNNNFEVIRPVGALYCAVKIPSQNILIICVDNYDASYDINNDTWNGSVEMSEAQLEWIAETVLDAEGYQVMFVTHVPTLASMSVSSEALALKPLDDLIKAAKNKTSYSSNNVTADFTSWTGDVICELAGHMHKDADGTSDNVLYIGTTCDSYADSDENVTRTQGTTSEQAFDVISVDAINKTIKCCRIGGGNDRTFSY